MFQAEVVEKIKTHFIFNNLFFSLSPFPKIVPFMRHVEKYSTAIQAKYENMTHAHWLLDA